MTFWGYVEIYIVSLLKIDSPNISMSSIKLIYFLIWIGAGLTTSTFSLYTKLFGYKEAISLFLMLWGISVLILAFFPTVWNFAMMVFMNGALEGPVTIAMGFLLIDMFPKNISLAIGIASIGTPLSLVVYAELGILLCNPDNILPNLSLKEMGVSYNYFDETVAKNLLKVFLIMGVSAVFLAVCLQLFCKNPEGIQNHILDYCPCIKKCADEKKNDEVQVDSSR